LPNPSEKIETESRLSFAARIPETVWALGVVSLLNSLGGDAVTPLLPGRTQAKRGRYDGR
jgi:hypothetical protein